MKNSFALICGDGIGDNLIFSIIGHHLRKDGHPVTLFSPHLHQFGSYLEPGEYRPFATNWEETLSVFDATILPYDGSARAKKILSLREKGLSLYVIYTDYLLSKCGPLLVGFDYPVDKQKTMVENVCLAMKEFFHKEISSHNCLKPLCDLSHRKNKKEVLIHPTSTKMEKNWRQNRFLHLARKLEKLHFEPTFILSAEERKAWPKEIFAPSFPNLEKLATHTYEAGFFIGNDSGPAHLASLFGIPHIVICQGRQMPLWSPGWRPPRLIQPPSWVPNIKWMRLRENRWQWWISTNRVLEDFLRLYTDCFDRK